MVRKFITAVFVAAILLVGVSAFAQTTGTLVGTVTTAGAPLPGATVTIASPALQGVRTTVSGANGDYSFNALPPGKYSVTAELEGMQKVTQSATVRLAETARADVDLKVSKVSEAITVTATTPSVLETPQVGTSLTREQVEALPLGRTIAQRIQLAPGVNNAGPNNQTIVNGAPSYDNLYMVNGVVVNDSIRGQPENLFVEDAIQETTLLTGGVSAEYGRFTGGVINTLTKSGGNEFSGSVRDNITNPSWQRPMPGAADNLDVKNNQYEGTAGGYFMKDRLWFFAAGRKFNESQAKSTVKTATSAGIPYTNQRNNKRYEVKLTGQITAKHSLVGSYLHNNTTESANAFGSIVDLRSTTARELPNWLEDYHYSGVITNSLLIEGQYSRRYFAFVGGGGPKDDLINGTLVRDNATARRAWSPTFCACDPKTRNNKDYLAKASYFLSTPSMGSHNIVGGYDDFHELRHENNFQSGSNFRVWGDFIYVGDNVFFHFDDKSSQIGYNPIAQLSKTNDVQTTSYFVNDKWDFSNHLSFNLGVRYDNDSAKDQSHNKVASSSAFSPRIGVIYDLKGDGRNRISAAYSKYVSHIDSGVADAVAAGGQPGSVYFNYRGPEINKVGTTPYLPTDQVIQQIFNWFNSVGGVNGFKDIASISVPGLTTKLAPGGLESPFMNEYTVGYGHQFGANAYLRTDLVHRDFKNFYSSFTNLGTGRTTLANGNPADIQLVGNSDKGLSRTYNGLLFQAAYKPWARLNLGGNYTYSTLKGNVEGETFNNATIFAGNNNYPEYVKFKQNLPKGYLNEDLRHRGNLFANYDAPIPWGSLNLGILERFHSGQPYSASANIRVAGGVITNPGYAVPPTNVTYFFSDRGQFHADSIKATDLSATYNFPQFAHVSVFLRGDLINAFNAHGVEFAQTAAGATIDNVVYTAAVAAPASIRPTCPTGVSTNVCRNGFYVFNPFTETPVQFHPGDDKNGHYNYMLSPTFGTPTNLDSINGAYQQPRTYRFAIGARF